MKFKKYKHYENLGFCLIDLKNGFVICFGLFSIRVIFC
jgi:hypothetical protein